jgi:nucleoside-diphosphate-sugar epimerase
MSRILITGAAGFVGSHLAEACVKADHQVHVIVRPGSQDERLCRIADRVTCHRIDLRADADVRQCLSDVSPEVVYHLAGSPRRAPSVSLEDARAYIGEDLDCLLSVIGAAAALRRPPGKFVRAGSLAEYGNAPLPYREDLREAPVTAYGAGMLAATHYLGALQPRLPFPVATARLALIYGPAQSTDYLLPLLIKQCLAGEASAIRRPDDRRDLLFAADGVAALMRMAATTLPPAAVVNICTGVAPTMREVAGLVLDATGADPGLVEFGDGPVSGAADLRGSPDRAIELMDWRAKTALKDGIAQTVAWYRAEAARRPVATATGAGTSGETIGAR